MKAMESVEVQEDRVVIRFTKDVSNFKLIYMARNTKLWLGRLT